MSFAEMKQPQLKEVAEEFGVDIPKGFVKNEKIIELLEADGVTFDQWQRLKGEPEEVETVKEETLVIEDVTNVETVLLKMTRANGTFEDRGYLFTAKHPFVAVKEDDAEHFVNNYEGFRVALPSEVKQYYS
jgi:hypothetical protein